DEPQEGNRVLHLLGSERGGSVSACVSLYARFARTNKRRMGALVRPSSASCALAFVEQCGCLLVHPALFFRHARPRFSGFVSVKESMVPPALLRGCLFLAPRSARRTHHPWHRRYWSFVMPGNYRTQAW